MIRQEFHVRKYWKVVVYFNVDYSLFDVILRELVKKGFSEDVIGEIKEHMENEYAKAATISNVRKHISYILFNKHSSKIDYINSIVHESVHVKQAMLEAYNVKDKGESPAYTMGYLVSKIYRIFNKLVEKS